MEQSTFLDLLRSETQQLTIRLEKAAATHSDETWDLVPARGLAHTERHVSQIEARRA